MPPWSKPRHAEDAKKFIADCEADQDDGPDWLFEENEVRSSNRSYVFCPAAHCAQLLRLFTKHFCQHPLLPEPNAPGPNHTFTSQEIYDNAVSEMYHFCYQRHLREVWAYMWTSWYQPVLWSLWARSSSPYLSRLRTTMNVESFGRRLKHDYLHDLIRPRLDQLVYIITTNVLPHQMQRAQMLEDTYRQGRSRPASSFQKHFKTEWKALAKKPTSCRSYVTNIEQWTCNCGQQKYSGYALCKHLVQAVLRPSPRFWIEIHRRRTLPIYQHPDLFRKGTTPPKQLDPEDRSITDGDDHTWLGDQVGDVGNTWNFSPAPHESLPTLHEPSPTLRESLLQLDEPWMNLHLLRLVLLARPFHFISLMEHSIPFVFLSFLHRHISLSILHISTTHHLFIASLVIALASVVVDLAVDWWRRFHVA